MKVLIDIPQEMFKATQTYYSDFTTRLSMKKCTEIIANGTPIPEVANEEWQNKIKQAKEEIESISQEVPYKNQAFSYGVDICQTSKVLRILDKLIAESEG